MTDRVSGGAVGTAAGALSSELFQGIKRTQRRARRTEIDGAGGGSRTPKTDVSIGFKDFDVIQNCLKSADFPDSVQFSVQF